MMLYIYLSPYEAPGHGSMPPCLTGTPHLTVANGKLFIHRFEQIIGGAAPSIREESFAGHDIVLGSTFFLLLSAAGVLSGRA